MSVRYMLMALMLVIGIAIGGFALNSKAPPERNAGTIAAVQSLATLPETQPPLQNEAPSPSIGLSRGIMLRRPRILAPSIRPFGSTQDRRGDVINRGKAVRRREI